MNDGRRKEYEMSDLEFTCPHCQQTLEAPEEMLGETIDCPSCNGSIQLPHPKAAVPSKSQQSSPAGRQASTTRDKIMNGTNKQLPEQSHGANWRDQSRVMTRPQ
jgi:hypothetical protein